MSRSRKFRNIHSHNTVAFVVDDIASRNPWRVRCLEIRGTAEQADVRIISFGIDDTETEPHLLKADSRDV